MTILKGSILRERSCTFRQTVCESTFNGLTSALSLSPPNQPLKILQPGASKQFETDTEIVISPHSSAPTSVLASPEGDRGRVDPNVVPYIDDRAKNIESLPLHSTMLSPQALPSHKAGEDVDHIGQLLNTATGFSLLHDSSDDLQCPYCTWKLQRSRSRPFSKIGAPRKYGDEAERRAGRSRVRKAARQKIVERKKEEFWTTVCEAVQGDRAFLKESIWRKEIEKIEQREAFLNQLLECEQQLDARQAILAEQSGCTARAAWCRSKVELLRRIMHS